MAAQQPAGDLRRYRFVPGQELTYHIDWTIRYRTRDRSALWDDVTDVVARVVRRNDDGSFRILFRRRETLTKTADGAQTVMEPSTSVFYADAFPDGRELPMPARGEGATPGMLFPPLPRDAGELKNGWTATLQDFTYRCTAAPGPDFRFGAKIDAPVMKALHDSHSAAITFDPARGLISGSDDNFFRMSNVDGAGGGTTRLVAERMIRGQELKQLADDVNVYFNALETYTALMARANDAELDRARQIAGDAAADLKAAVGRISDPDLKSDGEQRLRSHGTLTPIGPRK
jgi:hypothetical protein